MFARCFCLVFLVVVVAAGCHMARKAPPRSAPPGGDQPLAYGIAAGEVSATSAVIWSRCGREGQLTVALRAATGQDEGMQRVAVDAAHDFTGKVQFGNLQPYTRYVYRGWCGDVIGPGTAGHFQTAPAADDPQRVRFAWSGDLAGQNVCRDRIEGYAIFDRIRSLQPDFFVALGDMIYADSPCKAVSFFGYDQIEGPPTPATTVPEFWAVWRYNRADRHFQRFLSSLSYYAVWDDHEIMDDSGPHRDIQPQAPGVHLLPLARQAFLDYQPMLVSAEAPRLYRSARWGKHVELFLLDTRSYRDRNDAADPLDAPKTMLGSEQRAWFLEGLHRSDATWKVIVSSVPLSIPTGTRDRGRDGWANFDGETGFEHELLPLLRTMERDGIRNLIWITTDVHFATGFRYQPFADDPAFVFYEFATGPLNAGMFPKKEFDPTLGPRRLFMYGPTDSFTIHSFAGALSWFNFTTVDVDENGVLALRVVNGDGDTVYTTALVPQAR